MPFRHGKSAAVLYNGYDLSTFLNEASVSRSAEPAETTTFGVSGSAKTYITGLVDATISAKGLFDAAASAIDPVLAAALGGETADLITVAPEGLTLGRRAHSAKVRQTSYDVSSPVSDVTSASVEVQCDGGADSGVVLAARTAATATGNGTGVDDKGSSSSNGGVGYLHLTGNTRDGNTTIKIQHSTDNVTFADLITFTVVGAGLVASERLEVAGTVNRYIRATHTLAGSTGTATYSVTFARR